MTLKTESKLEKSFVRGKFVVTAEIEPPKHADASIIVEKVKVIREYCDAINITDNQTAIVRMSSIAAGLHVLNSGAEPIIQMTARDRNRLAMQSDFLGAYGNGIRNVLCLSGDHQAFGNHPTAKGVYDIDSIQMVNMLKKMRDEKKFLNGEKIEGLVPRFFIGAVENPFADPIEMRILRLQKKIEAGADFIQTQCIFCLDRFERWMELIRGKCLHKRVYIMAGVMPLKSLRMIEYLQQNVPGMVVPDELTERMKLATEPRQEGADICVEQIKRLQGIEGVAGIHIMSVGQEALITEIIKKAGIYSK